MLFDLGFVLGTSAYWQNVVGDTANHVAGFYYYVQDEWRYPIFFSKNHGYPEGSSVIFTDTVRILTLLVKSLRGVLPDGIQRLRTVGSQTCYFPGIGITALVIALGNRDIASTVAATILALCLPAFLVRVELASLSSHFLLTFALALISTSCGRTTQSGDVGVPRYSRSSVSSCILICLRWCSRFYPPPLRREFWISRDGGGRRSHTRRR